MKFFIDGAPVPRRFVSVTRGGLIGSVLVLIVALVCVRLGFWQVHRLAEKRTRNAVAHARMRAPPLRLTGTLLDSTGLLYRRTSVSGTYDDERTIVVAGRALNGAPGVHILTPVRIGGVAVMVNRGWLPSADAASVAVDEIREASPNAVPGIVVELTRDPRADSATSSFKRVWYHLNYDALRRQYPYPVADYAIQLLPGPDAPKAPTRLPVPRMNDEGPHLGYAIQWFSLAIIGIVGWLIMLLRSSAARIGERSQ